MGFVLLLVAIWFTCLLYPATFVYNLVHVLWNYPVRKWYRQLERQAFWVAYSIDQQGNVVCARLLNDMLIKRNSPDRFGNPDETISSVLGKNKASGRLTLCGKSLAWLLNTIDPNHVEKSVEKLYRRNPFH